jgi:hypothetical protein
MRKPIFNLSIHMGAIRMYTELKESLEGNIEMDMKETRCDN